MSGTLPAAERFLLEASRREGHCIVPSDMLNEREIAEAQRDGRWLTVPTGDRWGYGFAIVRTEWVRGHRQDPAGSD